MAGRNLIVTFAVVTALFLGARAFAPPASVDAYACADVTGDGRVNGHDIALFRKHVNNADPYDPAYDLNSDAEVNAVDLAIATNQKGTNC
jgi:hypothetical protein